MSKRLHNSFFLFRRYLRLLSCLRYRSGPRRAEVHWTSCALRTRHIKLIQFQFHLNIIIRFPLGQKNYSLHMHRPRELIDTAYLIHLIAPCQENLKISCKTGWLTRNVYHMVHTIIDYFLNGLWMDSITWRIQNDIIRFLINGIQNL